jgi:hypothetical protein
MFPALNARCPKAGQPSFDLSPSAAGWIIGTGAMSRMRLAYADYAFAMTSFLINTLAHKKRAWTGSIQPIEMGQNMSGDGW